MNDGVDKVQVIRWWAPLEPEWGYGLRSETLAHTIYHLLLATIYLFIIILPPIH